MCPAAFTIASLTLRDSICESECQTCASGKSRRNCSESSDFTLLRLIQMESFSFRHCVGKPDLCCCLKNHFKRFVDQQDVWQSISQSKRSVGLSTRQLHFLSRIHILFDKILCFFRGWRLTLNFVLIQCFFCDSCFVRCVNKIVTLLECYAVYIVGYLMTFRDNLSIPSSRVKQYKIE